MSLIPWRHRPATPARASQLQHDFNSIFDEFFRDFAAPSLRGVPGTGDWAPAVTVSDNDSAVTVKVEIPGVDPKDVEVTATDNLLTIKGEKKEEKVDEGESYYRREATYGSFLRQIALPADVDANHAEASTRDGVLTLRLPKTREAKAKVIKVK